MPSTIHLLALGASQADAAFIVAECQSTLDLQTNIFLTTPVKAPLPFSFLPFQQNEVSYQAV